MDKPTYMDHKMDEPTLWAEMTYWGGILVERGPEALAEKVGLEDTDPRTFAVLVTALTLLDQVEDIRALAELAGIEVHLPDRMNV